MTIQFQVQGEPVKQVEKFAQRVQEPGFVQNIAKALAKLVRQWLSDKNKAPNKMNWPKQGFYGDAARSTHWEAMQDVARVIVSKEGFRQRYFGGTIKPINADALTIPVAPQAYGKRAREFPDLVLVKFKVPKGKVTALLMLPHKGSAFGTVFYLLVGAVKQAADKTVLPPLEKFTETITEAVRKYLKLPQGGS
jgi:hypothetical protein